MARLPDRSSRFMLIATFIICSSILFVDFRFDTFKPVQNFYNSSSIFIRVFSSEYIVRPNYIDLFQVCEIQEGLRKKIKT